jgi:hypothetical protein
MEKSALEGLKGRLAQEVNITQASILRTEEVQIKRMRMIWRETIETI